MTILIRKTEIGALIDRVEGNIIFYLGSVAKHTQFKGTEDEYSWYEGYFDTKPVRFEEFEDLVAIIQRLKPGDEVEVVNR